MDDRNEPTDVGPVVGGDKTIDEADRDQVIILLTAATSEGRLPALERDLRIADARAATTFDDLIPLTRDLVNVEVNVDSTTPTWNTLSTPPTNYSIGTGQTSDQVIAIFAGTNRKGDWEVPKNLVVFACFGGASLDFTQARFASREVHLNICTLFGGVDIVIPRGAQVRDKMVSIFGGSEHKKLEPSRSDVPVFILQGLNLFGGVSISHPKKNKY